MQTTTLYADHLILDVHDSRNQWHMTVNNHGVVIGSTYGPLPRPDDETLRTKARSIAARLPQNMWGVG